MFGVLILFAIINRFFMSFDVQGIMSIPFGVSLMVYGAIMVAIFVLTLIVMIQRFYKNLLCDEGYLMFTLPVKTWQHIATKTITSLAWIIASLVISLLSVLILSINSGFWTNMPDHFFQLLSQSFYAETGISFYAFSGELLLLLIIGSLSSIMTIYAAIAIGQLNQRHKLLAAFGAYLAINVIIQIITSVGMYICSYSQSFNQWINGLTPVEGWHLLINGGTVYSLVCTVILYIIVQAILKRKLNLE